MQCLHDFVNYCYYISIQPPPSIIAYNLLPLSNKVKESDLFLLSEWLYCQWWCIGSSLPNYTKKRNNLTPSSNYNLMSIPSSLKLIPEPVIVQHPTPTLILNISKTTQPPISTLVQIISNTTQRLTCLMITMVPQQNLHPKRNRTMDQYLGILFRAKDWALRKLTLQSNRHSKNWFQGILPRIWRSLLITKMTLGVLSTPITVKQMMINPRRDFGHLDTRKRS